MNKETGEFAPRDLAYIVSKVLLHTGNPVEAFSTLFYGIKYNQAKKSGDPEKIYQAFLVLPREIKLMKHNSTRRRPTN